MAKAPTYQDLIDQAREDKRELDTMRRRLDQAVMRAQVAESVPRKPLTLPRNPNDDYHRQFGMARPAPEEPAGASDARAVSRQHRRVLARGSRPNAGVEALYRQRLETKIGEMNASVLYWLRSAYRNNPPEMARDAQVPMDSGYLDVVRMDIGDMAGSASCGDRNFGDLGRGGVGLGDNAGGMLLALDRTPASILKAAFDKLAKRWLRQFDELADWLAGWFSAAAADRSDAALRNMLRQSGMSVRFTMTPAMRDVLDATVHENVVLIRSIPEQYLTQVEGSVMRSVTAGRDLASLTTELREHHGVTKRRAKLIAHQQNNAATAAFTRVRQVQYGLKAIWMHSHAGKVPRPTHLANNGKTYDPVLGWMDPAEGKHIFPGQLINCFPEDMPIGLETRPSRLWRTYFNGPMIHIRVGADLLKGTPNHPVLTRRGWVPLGILDSGDELVCMSIDDVDRIDHHKYDRKATFGDLFAACARIGINRRRDVGSFDFHGQVPGDYVDEVVIVDDMLSRYLDPAVFQKVSELALSKSDPMGGVNLGGIGSHVSAAGGASLGDNNVLLLGRSGVSSQDGLRAGSHHSAIDQDLADISSGPPRSTIVSRNGGGPHTGLIHLDDVWSSRFPIVPSVDIHSLSPELFAEFVSIAANSHCRIFEFGSGRYEFRAVSHKVIRYFSGHVFTAQTETGYYSVGDAFIQAKNCRCWSKTIIPGFQH